jgi:hypothetical protein
LNIIEKVLSRIESRYELVVEYDRPIEINNSMIPLESSIESHKYDSQRAAIKKSIPNLLTTDDPVVTYIPSSDWVMYSILDGKILWNTNLKLLSIPS